MEVLFFERLSEEERDALWEQGVDLDDWDYLLVFPPEVLEDNPDYDAEKAEKNWSYDEPRYYVSSYNIERLLQGVCSNRWYRVTFRGRECAVGVAYHA